MAESTFSSVPRFLFERFSRNITTHTLPTWAIKDVSFFGIGLQ